MIEIKYYEAYREMKNSYDTRFQLVRFVLENNVSRAAQQFGTTRKTVRKWLGRYLQEGRSGLIDRTRRPHYSPSKLAQDEAERILAIRRRQPYLGALRIKTEHDICASPATIHRVIRSAGLIRPRKHKSQVKRDLRAVKAQMRAFEKIQIDLKDLSDIPRYYPYLRQNYPKYQITARDVRTGLMYLGYAYEKTTTNVAVFTYYLGQHLLRCGVDLSQVVWQSDNGTEFIGPWNQKHKQTLYQQIIQRLNSESIQIPVGRKTYNSDVEAAHRLIEDEFYDMEDYRNPGDLLSKAFTYSIYFNYKRKFRYKNMKSPIEILSDLKPPKIIPETIGILPPIIADHHLHTITKSGYHVPRSDN
jgi:transposase